MPTDWFYALLGGLLIGLSVSLLLLFTGKIAGISGIVDGTVVRRQSGEAWKTFFLLGMLAIGAVGSWMDPSLVRGHIASPSWTLVVAGLLVGFGTRLANGCTSGHGVAGIARLSRRSFSATMIFTFAGMAAVAMFKAFGWIL